ncbi:MAG: hypothetical protein AAGK97_07450, partial [Bacteroidota bacterium]
KNESISEVKDFRFTDYNSFLEYLKQSDFTYETKSEQYLNKMKKEAESNNMLASIQAEIAKIETAVKKEKETNIQKDKQIILDEIEREIVSRYYFQNGKVQQKLNQDSEIKAAIDLLNNKDKYASILK